MIKRVLIAAGMHEMNFDYFPSNCSPLMEKRAKPEITFISNNASDMRAYIRKQGITQYDSIIIDNPNEELVSTIRESGYTGRIIGVLNDRRKVDMSVDVLCYKQRQGLKPPLLKILDNS